MSRETTGHTLTVAAVLCVVCSILVSGATVGLRSFQEVNKARQKQLNVLLAAGVVASNGQLDQERLKTDYGYAPADVLPQAGGDWSVRGDRIEKVYKKLVTDVAIDLDTGRPAKLDDPKYDAERAATSSAGVDLKSGDRDLARIGRRERVAVVHEFHARDGHLTAVVLPVRGKGLWSTLYGFLALEADFNTVRGLTFYKHGETPGLGGEVDNPKWKAQWPGKKVFDAEGQIALKVKKGVVDTNVAEEKTHQVDGLSGATFTARGVSNLVVFWLGEDGFGKYLAQAKAGG